MQHKNITKNVEITLSEQQWQWIETFTQGHISDLLRYFMLKEQSPKNEWSNFACLGYMISAGEKCGFSKPQIEKLVQALHSEFDHLSIEEAEDIYRKY